MCRALAVEIPFAIAARRQSVEFFAAANYLQELQARLVLKLKLPAAELELARASDPLALSSLALMKQFCGANFSWDVFDATKTSRGRRKSRSATARPKNHQSGVGFATKIFSAAARLQFNFHRQ
jgi:hypothetical protein